MLLNNKTMLCALFGGAAFLVWLQSVCCERRSPPIWISRYFPPCPLSEQEISDSLKININPKTLRVRIIPEKKKHYHKPLIFFAKRNVTLFVPNLIAYKKGMQCILRQLKKIQRDFPRHTVAPGEHLFFHAEQTNLQLMIRWNIRIKSFEINTQEQCPCPSQLTTEACFPNG